MKYQFPIQVAPGQKLILTNPFNEPAAVDESHALAVETHTHDGVDVVLGSAMQTWGREVVWPFPFPGTVYDAEVDSTFDAKVHCHSQIDGIDPERGIAYSLVYLHLSAVTKSKAPTDTEVITYNEGDVIGYIGNNGSVHPVPTPEQPLAGSHLHLGLGVKKPGELNYTMVDPLTLLDINVPFFPVFAPEPPFASCAVVLPVATTVADAPTGFIGSGERIISELRSLVTTTP